MPIYATLLLLVIAGPLLVSSLTVYRFNWLRGFWSVTLVALPFLLWDIWFTAYGYWGFNQAYLLGWRVFTLPLEEVLFFWIVPLACLFLYQSVKRAKWQTGVPKYLPKIMFLLIGVLSLILATRYTKPYTVLVAVVTLVCLLTTFKAKWWSTFVATLPLLVLCFIAVNGILTFGIPQLSPEPIVWYSDVAISTIRLGSIPIEDFLYAFTLIALSISIYEYKYTTKQ